MDPDPPCLSCMHTQIHIYIPLIHGQEMEGGSELRNYFT